MNADRPGRSPVNLLGTFCILSAVAAVSGGTARAGCHAAVSMDPARVAHLEGLALAGALSLPLDQDGKRPIEPPPCAGGRCSPHEPRPIAPATVFSPGADRWVASLPNPPLPDAERRPYRPEARRLLPLYHSPAPERPPRQATS
jgi:hypothetical protein